MLKIHLPLELRDFGSGQTGVLQGDGLSLFAADVGLIAGRTGGVYLLQCQIAGLAHEIELIDGQGSQLFKGVQGVLFDDPADQLCLAQGDAVGIGLCLQIAVLGNGLAQNGAVKSGGAQQLGNLLGQACLQLGGVLAVHADQDGVVQLTEIAVSQHGADQCVDSHIQRAAAEVHVAHDDLAVVVQGVNGQNVFFLVDLNFNAGVDVQRDGGGNCTGGVALCTENTGNKQDQGSGDAGNAALPGVSFLGISHGNFSFLFFAVSENRIQNIRRHMGDGLLDFAF